MLRDSKPMLIGQAPGRRHSSPARRVELALLGKADAAFVGSKRLEHLFGCDFHERFDCVNLLGEYPGKNGKGDVFPLLDARLAAIHMNFTGVPFLLLAGWGVARAFGPPYPIAYFQRYLVRGTTQGFVVPHPSGVNRWWNDPKNMRAAVRFFRRAARAAIA